MPDRSDSHVAAALDDVARHIAYPEGDDLAEPVVARLRAARPLERAVPRWLVPAVAAVVVVAVVLAIPGPREALARWLGIGGVRVTFTGEVPGDVGTRLTLGEAVSLDEAADALTFTLRAPDGIGNPAAAFVGRPPGGASLVWAPSSELPEVEGTGVGLLLTAFPATTTTPLIEKEIGPTTSVEAVTVNGEEAFWITGAPHTFHYVTPDGGSEFDTTRLAGNTLIWVDHGVTYRLESGLERDRAIELAESMQPLG